MLINSSKWLLFLACVLCAFLASGSVQGKSDPAKPAKAKSEPAKPVKGKSEPAKPVKAKSEPAKPVKAKSEPAKPVKAKSEPAKPVKATSEPAKLSDVTSTQWKDAATANKKLVVVFVKAKGCQTCEEMTALIGEVNGHPDLDAGIKVGKSSDTKLAASIGVTTYPTVVFLRENTPVFYDGKVSLEELLQWMELSRSKVTQVLHEDSFEHLTQASTGATTGDWLVAFYKNSCTAVLPVLESVGVRIRQTTNVAIVDTAQNKMLAERFAIKKCPEIILFKQGKMYRYAVSKLDQQSVKSFVGGWYKNSKAETVLPPKSRFDFITEAIASYIKAKLEGGDRKCTLCIVGGVAVVMLGLVFCCCRSVAGSSKKRKAE